ncbi:hypothetical protein DY000_02012902 [Brassica cretica]|uniref:Uncharacterized protein n=1 Tax=Brassica cretica TaxID=69181 RepID=A0ABQ7CM21_BRACR|nr:hypothetical protein DY000_02012902 [Brassica cretica]
MLTKVYITKLYLALCGGQSISHLSTVIALVNSHPETLARGVNHYQRWLGYWCEGAVVWRGKRGEVFLREVGATKALSSPAQVSGRWLASSASSRSVLSTGGEGLHSLTSPALVVRSGGFVFGSGIACDV